MATKSIGWGDADTRQIERQRALADRLLQRSETPLQGQNVGGVYVAPHWTQQLAGALSGVVGDKINSNADTRETELAQQRRTMLADQLKNFNQTAAGTPAREIAPLTPNDDDGNPNVAAQVPAKPGNLAAAYGQLLGSEVPELQQFGMQGTMQYADQQAKLAQQAAERQRLQGILTGAKTPQEALAAGAPAELVKTYFDQGLGRTKLAFQNGQGVDPYTGAPVGNAIPKQPEAFTLGDTRYGADGKPIATYSDPNKPFAADGTPNLPFQQYSVSKAKAGASNVNVVQTGQKEFEKQLGELDAKQLGKYREGAEAAQGMLSTIQSMRASEQQGAFSGGGADAKLAAANLLNGLTGIEIKGLVGSQTYNAEANKLVLDRVKALGANPSNADRDFIQKTVPQLSTSATARKAMADFMERKASETIGLYQRADAHARKNHGLGGFDQFNMPTTGAPAAGGGGAVPESDPLNLRKK